MNNKYIPEYRKLKDSGWQVSKHPAVRFNASGESETIGHFVSKAIAAKLCLQNGYMIDTEVVSEHGYGEIDLICYSPDRITMAVELETNPDEDTKQDKLERYVKSNNVIEDMQMIAVDELPNHLLDMRDRIITELGFY